MWVILLASACHQPPAGAVTHAPPGHLLIAHTNDLHTHIEPVAAPWVGPGAVRGGAVALSSHLEALRDAQGDDAVLYLDAGDLSSGTPLMEFEVHGAQGGAMLDFLDAQGCAAWTLGNHDLDRGFENTERLVNASPMPVLAANLAAPGSAWSDPPFEKLEDHELFEVNGVRVGVFGLTTSALVNLASPRTMSRIELLDVATTARHQVEMLRPHVDVIVALTHQGVEQDRWLAHEVQGIDLIVGGHSHTRLEAPEKVDDTWIVQAGSNGTDLGVVELDVDADGLTALSARLEALDPDVLPAAPLREVRTLERAWKERVHDRFETVLGEVEGPITRTGEGETEMGRWASDLVREAGEAEVGLYNSGGLRADLAGGPTTLAELYEVFPFGNEVVSFDATGSELLGLALQTAYAVEEDNRGPAQWSGLTFTWGTVKGAPELRDVRVGGQPIDPARIYRLATNSFVAEQWRYNLSFEPRRLRRHEVTILATAEASLRAGGVRAPTDSRYGRAEVPAP